MKPGTEGGIPDFLPSLFNWLWLRLRRAVSLRKRQACFQLLSLAQMIWFNNIIAIMTNRIALALVSSLTLAFAATAATIEVQVDKPGHKVAPTLWGVFFEDINLSADGGIYPEQVRNRSFEDADKLENWTFTNVGDGKSEAGIDSTKPLNPLNRRSLRVKVDGAFTLENGGYYGMGIAKGEGYTFKAALRGDKFAEPITIKLLGADGK